MCKTNNYLVIDPTQPQRILAIIDEAFAAWWAQNLPALRLIQNPELSFGVLTDSEVGRFEYVYTKEREFLLTSKPDNMSLGAAYEYLFKNIR